MKTTEQVGSRILQYVPVPSVLRIPCPGYLQVIRRGLNVRDPPAPTPLSFPRLSLYFQGPVYGADKATNL